MIKRKLPKDVVLFTVSTAVVIYMITARLETDSLPILLVLSGVVALFTAIVTLVNILDHFRFR